MKHCSTLPYTHPREGQKGEGTKRGPRGEMETVRKKFVRNFEVVEEGKKRTKEEEEEAVVSLG